MNKPTFTPGTMISDQEISARTIGANKSALRRELNGAVSLLLDKYRVHFRARRFDFDAKRLYGADGYYLQWATRAFPDMPESYNNQQCSRGVVFLLKIQPGKLGEQK